MNLPVRQFGGTEFVLNTDKMLFFEKQAPENKIFIADIEDTGNGYSFDYCKVEKYIANPFMDSGHVVRVELPPLVIMDAAGMARKYGLTIQEIKGKSDFEVMVDQEAFRKRLAGQLPTIDICGNTFRIHADEGRLSLKGASDKHDICFRGINFAQYFSQRADCWIIPFNPVTRTFQGLDFRNMIAYPKDLKAAMIPSLEKLDPFGYWVDRRLGPMTFLKVHNVKMHSTANEISWKQTSLEGLIKRNIARIKKEHRQNVHGKEKTPLHSKPKVRHGRSL